MIYTDEQIQWLRDNRALNVIDVITASFNQRFGTNLSKKALSATCKRKSIKAGSNGQFKKGSLPHIDILLALKNEDSYGAQAANAA